MYFDQSVFCGTVLFVLHCELPDFFIRVPQENKDPQEHLEIKAPQAQLVLLALKDLVVILVLM